MPWPRESEKPPQKPASSFPDLWRQCSAWAGLCGTRQAPMSHRPKLSGLHGVHRLYLLKGYYRLYIKNFDRGAREQSAEATIFELSLVQPGPIPCSSRWKDWTV